MNSIQSMRPSCQVGSAFFFGHLRGTETATETETGAETEAETVRQRQ